MRRSAAWFLAMLCWSATIHAQTPLADAIKANDAAGVDMALTDGADPDQRLGFGATPLMLAVNAQNPDIVKRLLAKGAKPDMGTSDGVTPLALACELGDAAIVAALLDAHADVRIARPDGVTPLAICARFGPSEAVARMLADGAVADKPDASGQTPLMWAASSGRVEAIAPLLKAGAKVNRVTEAGFTPLFFAIRNGSVPACEALLAAGAHADYRGPENSSALQLALYQHHYAAAALFVAQGDLAERDREGRQPLHVAAAGGDTALVAAMLAKGADVNGLTGPTTIKWVTEANFGMPPPPVPPTPPLLMAAAGGHAAVMHQLIDAGAKVDFAAQDGTNVLIAAASSGSIDALSYALNLAPDANVVNAFGATAMHVLLNGGPQPQLEAMLRVLAAHGARIDIKTKRGVTVAQMADTGLTDVRTIFRKVFPEAPTEMAARP